jgi:hypothetical protein
MAGTLRKTAAGSQSFRPDLYQAQILTADVRPLERLAIALRRTRGKIAASHFTTKTHAAASGFLRGGKMASGTVAESTDAMKLRKIFHREAARR